MYKLDINKVYLFLREGKLLIRDSTYKLYINKVYLLLRDAHEGFHYKLYINTVYLLLRDATLPLRDPFTS